MRFFLCAFMTMAVAILGLPSQGLTTLYTYTAPLDGVSESPSNASPGTGLATVIFDSTANTLRVEVSFADLLGTTTAAHIHSPTSLPLTGTAGVATTLPTFPGFPLGVTTGTYDHTFDLTDSGTYNPAFIAANGGTTTGAEAALIASLAAETAYLNIHSTVIPGGEIRGFLVPIPVPGTMLLLGTGLAGLAGIRLRRKK